MWYLNRIWEFPVYQNAPIPINRHTIPITKTRMTCCCSEDIMLSVQMKLSGSEKQPASLIHTGWTHVSCDQVVAMPISKYRPLWPLSRGLIKITTGLYPGDLWQHVTNMQVPNYSTLDTLFWASDATLLGRVCRAHSHGDVTGGQVYELPALSACLISSVLRGRRQTRLVLDSLVIKGPLRIAFLLSAWNRCWINAPFIT